jgi:universal stress protein E
MANIKSILAVIDPTSRSQVALERSTWLAKALGATIELFICDYDPDLAQGRFVEGAGKDKARRELLNKHLRRLRRMKTELAKEGISANVDACWDHPLASGIVRKAAATQPLLVVKETHYHPVLKRALFSNTEWDLIRTCPCPLLLAKQRKLAEASKILACVDPMHEHDKPAALDHAIMTIAKELATAVGGELHAFHSFDPAAAIVVASDTLATPISMPVREITERIEQEHRAALRALLKGYGVKADKVHLYQGPTTDLLQRVTEDLTADFVVMGAVSRTGLKRVFIGSTAERVLDRLPCDLLVVKAQAPAP